MYVIKTTTNLAQVGEPNPGELCQGELFVRHNELFYRML